MNGSGQKRPWTDDDDLVMEKLYATTASDILVEILNRTENSIRVRAHFLKLPKCKAFRSMTQSENGKKRYRAADAVVYKPKPKVIIPENVECTTGINKEYVALMITIKSNIKALREAGQDSLANMTKVIAEKISAARSSKRNVEFEFLTVQDAMKGK